MRTAALLFGLILLSLGILGFVHASSGSDRELFNVFKINVGLNSLHLISGMLGLVALVSIMTCRIYFQIIGIVYAILALMGFIYAEEPILGIFASNQPNSWFHVVLAIAALVIGYGNY